MVQRLWPVLTKFGTCPAFSAKIGRCRPASANSDQMWAGFDRIWGEKLTIWAKVGPRSTKFRRVRPSVGPKWAKLGTDSAKLSPKLGTLGLRRAASGRQDRLRGVGCRLPSWALGTSASGGSVILARSWLACGRPELRPTGTSPEHGQRMRGERADGEAPTSAAQPTWKAPIPRISAPVKAQAEIRPSASLEPSRGEVPVPRSSRPATCEPAHRCQERPSMRRRNWLCSDFGSTTSTNFPHD